MSTIDWAALRPDTRILQQAITNLKFPVMYGFHLLEYGLESVECLSQFIDGKHYDVISDKINVGHLIMIRTEAKKLLHGHSQNNGISTAFTFRLYSV